MARPPKRPKPRATREEIAAYWLEKYGEPIDCEALRRSASLETVEEQRLRFAEQALMRTSAEFLERQARELVDFVRSLKVPGTDATLLERMGAYAKASEGRADLLAGSSLLLRFADHAIRTHALAKEMRNHAEDSHVELSDEMPPELAEQMRQMNARLRLLGINGPEPKTRASDEPRTRAAWYVSEWIRARHRNVSGDLDGETSWDDVAFCLKWHGHRGANGMALRRATKRLAAKLIDRG